jgi:hypothetical protein
MQALLAAVVVAIGAAYALDWLDRSPAKVNPTEHGNFRL